MKKFSTTVKMILMSLAIVWGLNFVAAGWFSIKWEIAAPNFIFGFGVIAVALASFVFECYKINE